jgi:hypothetical protein
MHEPRLVGLEGFVPGLFGFGLHGLERTDAVAAQATVQPRARDVGRDEFAYHRQQIVQRQHQGLAQLHHDGFLKRGQVRLQAVRRVRTIFDVGAFLPTPNGVLRHPQFPGKTAHRQVRVLDIAPGRGGSGGVLVQSDHHDCCLRSSSISSRIVSRPMNNARRRGSMQLSLV